MATPADYQWAYSIMDSSRVSTFLISILLIVYGSFRSLNMEQEAREREKEKERAQQGLAGLPTGTATPATAAVAENNVQTLDTMQALCLPLGASVSLLVMFFFFDSMQMLFAICTAIIATVALAFLLLPMCQYIIRPCSDGNKISFGVCGRFTGAELLSFSLAVFIVCIWVLTGHWLLMDAMGMGLCVAFIAFVRLPSLKVSTLLLTGLLIYDVFWVFFSSYIFNTNVMVKVATRPAENPVGLVARKLHLGGMGGVREAPKLSLPGKLVFPSLHHAGHFSMLGLGDVVMPGLLLCFVLRYDAYKKSQLLHLADTGVPPPRQFSKLSYFHCSLIGYFLGLLTATVSSEVFKAAQPALLYLVPFTLLPLLTMAYLKGDLRRMWSEPFIIHPPSKHLEV
ncbi:signal peptide peptidase-like 3 [Schistocerca americana]|uniref:signal peptide peptidase-like 3 n=1 Tax=Schistocerca americana TaxID=7009 RepID=UPI001F4F489F|nr:signal peptide peptidase-like 3 [Schistocerca americana]XP_047097457.1 signal peptide peptidase-like 3 [Schistocerca piceifrons]XP_049766919.1 signal peptide peptidase-like 3 isoform X1 [Schistocerca cancellata]XP_049793488.1 signal peptide peptidase-like 3 [Schistocerca nitens]XP_049941529.1 signal peptide peptidase-like 3 [Schistocerca serialis cubense]